MQYTEYNPAPHVIDRLKQVRFVAIIGPTAVGKSTLITALMRRDPSIHLVLNNTTRAARPEEREGIDYLFKTRADMEARIARGEYVQVAPSVLGDLYATAPEGYSIEGISVMAVLADAMPVFRSLPFQSLHSVFVLPPDWETWQRQLAQHGFTPEQRAKRLDEAQRSLQFALDDTETKLIINDDVETAVDDFLQIAFGRPLDERQQQDQVRARQIAQDLLDHLRQG